MSSYVKKCDYCEGSAQNWCGENTGFLECGKCGLVYRNPMPTEVQLSNMYSEYYSSENIAGENTHMVSSDLSTIQQANYIKNLVSPSAKVLDFGAGTGELAARLKAAGLRVDGVEYSEDAANVAYQRHGIKFHTSLDQLNDKKGQFDLITGIEVIEHLSNPDKILTELFSLLKPGGGIYLTTPNRNGLQGRLKKCQWREAMKPFHLILFNYSSLKHLLIKNGFKSVRYLRFSPLTVETPFKVFQHKLLQLFGLYGGLRVMAYKAEITK